MDVRSFFGRPQTPTKPQPEPVPTYPEVLASKTLPADQLQAEFVKLTKYEPKHTSRCFAGNPILYHYQLDNLCKVKVGKASFHDVMMNDDQRQLWWDRANHYANGSRPNQPALRLFEMWRRMNGAVVFFRPTIAMNLYAQFNATSVLDPTAGWGGRMLGAMAMGLAYTGVDTNTDLKPAYDEMIQTFPSKHTPQMIWNDALQTDFSTLDYDFVLTSPPYVNLEVYPHMTPYETNAQFYKTFLMPLLDKCRKHIKRGGRVAFNISPKMYRDLLSFGYEPADQCIPMLQQKVQGKDKGDMVYVW